jgi:hypothetical protein
MTGETNRLVEKGERALLAGDWVGARDAFRIALRDAETPEAFNGLGEALWWLGATQDSISARERAYAGFRRAQDQAHAADVALTLSVHYRANVGNAAASAGWLARAARLINDFRLEDMRGWLLLMQAYEADPVSSEGLAREANEHASRSGDLDLELCALSQLGSALVSGSAEGGSPSSGRSDGRVAERRGWSDRHHRVHKLQHDRLLRPLRRFRACGGMDPSSGSVHQGIWLPIPLRLLPGAVRRRVDRFR